MSDLERAAQEVTEFLRHVASNGVDTKDRELALALHTDMVAIQGALAAVERERDEARADARMWRYIIHGILQGLGGEVRVPRSAFIRIDKRDALTYYEDNATLDTVVRIDAAHAPPTDEHGDEVAKAREALTKASLRYVRHRADYSEVLDAHAELTRAERARRPGRA